MSIQGYTPETTVINFRTRNKEWKDGDSADTMFTVWSFTIRGLNLDDISLLIANHVKDVEAAYELFLHARKSVFSTASFDTLAVTIIHAAPVLVSEMISVAADEPELLATFRTLPFSVQSNALYELFRLTFEDVGGVKNLFAMLTKMTADVLPETLRQAASESLEARKSNASTGDSAKT